MIPCICPDGSQDHLPECPVAHAFRYRCPDCRSRKRPDGTFKSHANHCEFKGVVRP